MTKIRKSFILLLVTVFMLSISIATSLLISKAIANSDDSYHKSDVIVSNSNVKEVVCGETFYNQFHVNQTALTGNAEKAMLVGKSKSGIGVYSSGSSMEFSYKNAIDFSDKTAKDSIIEVYPMFGEKFAQISDIQIKLTDTEDASNTVVMHYEANEVDGLAIYARVIYKNKDISFAESSGHIFNGIRGTYLQNCSYGAHVYNSKGEPVPWEQGQISPFTMHLDYETKVVSSSYYSNWGVLVERNVLDLDDSKQVGANYEWDGFTNGTAYVSVSVFFSESVTDSKAGGVFVKSIDGVNLEGDFKSNDDFPKQDIVFTTEKEYGESLPYGAVGVEYKVPDIIASDWYFGRANDENVSYVIEKKISGDRYQPTTFKGANGGTHIFNEAGEYRIKYTATNGMKQAERTLDFEIKEVLAPILVGQAEQYKVPQLNSYFYIPETVIGGGSGNLVKKETLYYNGVEVSLGYDREIFIDKSGYLSLKVEVDGYVGDTYVRYFPIEIEEGIFLAVENMPKLIRGNNAEQIVLPLPVAYNSVDGSAVDVKITADGKVLGEDRKLSTSKTVGGVVNVVYSAGNVSKQYQLQVIESSILKQTPSSYIIKNGDIKVEDTSGGIVMNTVEDNSGFTWGYPVVSGFSSQELRFSLSQVSNDLDFEYIDIILSDAGERYKDYTIRVFKENILAASAVESVVHFNKNPENYIMNGAINMEGTSFNFYIKNNIVYNNKGILVKDISNEYNADVSYVTVKLGGVNGKASIRLDTLSNQSMGYDAKYGWNDLSPTLSFPIEMSLSSKIALGESFTIPSCVAYDLTSATSSVTVSVRKSDDFGALISNKSCEVNNVFTPTEIGSYSIDYNVVDGKGNSGRISYILTVSDLDTPVINIEGKIKDKIKVGSVIELPKASATDKQDGDCEVRIYVRKLSSYSLELVKDNKYNFNEIGEYEIIYQSKDLSWNYTQYITRITVTEK